MMFLTYIGIGDSNIKGHYLMKISISDGKITHGKEEIIQGEHLLNNSFIDIIFDRFKTEFIKHLNAGKLEPKIIIEPVQ